MTLSDNLRGALYMNLSMFAFTVNDAFMKSVTHDLPLFQTIALRGTVAVLCLLAVARITGGFTLAIPAPALRIIALRSLADVAATILFLSALMHMPLANLSAVMQAIPLAVTLGAVLYYKDAIGWRRMTAILAGFLGVMIIIRPGTDGFDIWSVMGLASVLAVVVRDLAARCALDHGGAGGWGCGDVDGLCGCGVRGLASPDRPATAPNGRRGGDADHRLHLCRHSHAGGRCRVRRTLPLYVPDVGNPAGLDRLWQSARLLGGDRCADRGGHRHLHPAA